MDYEAEILKLKDWHAEAKAESMAIQFVLMGALTAMKRRGHNGQLIIDETFRYAEAVSEIAFAKMGSPDHAGYLTKIAKVIEQLRSTVLNDSGQPKGGV